MHGYALSGSQRLEAHLCQSLSTSALSLQTPMTLTTCGAACAGADLLLRLVADLLPAGLICPGQPGLARRSSSPTGLRGLWAVLAHALACAHAFALPVSVARARGQSLLQLPQRRRLVQGLRTVEADRYPPAAAMRSRSVEAVLPHKTSLVHCLGTPATPSPSSRAGNCCHDSVLCPWSDFANYLFARTRASLQERCSFSFCS